MRIKRALYGICLLSCITSVYSAYEFILSSAQSDKLRHIVGSSRSLLISELDAETGQRGYLITDAPEYLVPYNAGMSSLQKNLLALNLATSGTTQSSAAKQINDLSIANANEMDRVINIRIHEGPEAASAAVRTNAGKQLMDQLRVKLDLLQIWSIRQLADTTEDNVIYARFSFFSMVAALITGISGFYRGRHLPHLSDWSIIVGPPGPAGPQGPIGADGAMGPTGSQGAVSDSVPTKPTDDTLGRTS